MSAEIIEFHRHQLIRKYRQIARDHGTTVQFDAEGWPSVQISEGVWFGRRAGILPVTSGNVYTADDYGRRRDAARKGWALRRARERARVRQLG